MTSTCQIGPYTVGPENSILIIAGPCVLESSETNSLIGIELRDICSSLGLPFIFKASFDKANRSSIHSDRGPGLKEGLKELSRLRDELGVPVTTDIHEANQAGPAAEVVDLLQVPAFLCRQTDLLVACAETGKPVNVKKGQFMAPSEMKNVLTKLIEAGCESRMLTERGTFFGYHRLVNDFTGLSDLIALGAPVCFDVTHSTQLPGGDSTQSGGRPEAAPLLARAATAAGVHALFLECHPNPTQGRSDSATMLQLSKVESILNDIVAIKNALNPVESTTIH